MKFGEKARIIYSNARDGLHMLHGYRAMLDYYCYDTSVVLVNVEPKLREALKDKTSYALTILLCHGWGKTDEDAVLNWSIQRQLNETEWEPAELHWTKDNVAGYVQTGTGILLNTACWGAKKVWADAFLRAGFDWYIAAEKTADMFSAYQFVSAFLGYLLYEVRDYGKRCISIFEAVEMARKIDDFWDGAAGFRIYGKGIEPAHAPDALPRAGDA
jgi:hypothetical protein